MKYYRHIDGLRALAVLSVVLFHLDVSWFKSGFLGVDIFFVISGFLITSIIIRDLENKNFSIKNFYLRRMRRILPALIVVLIFSTVFAWLILLPEDLKNYSKSLVSALGSFSNLYFFKSLNFGYFSTDATVIPLLHTWSLGIEEQFYIFWPLFLIFAFNLYIGIGWKDKQSLSNYNKLIIVSIVLFCLSLFCFRYFSYFQISNYFEQEKFYYFPLTRAFELLFGCMLAIYLTKHKPIRNGIILEILSFVSIILMLYPVLFKEVPYPSNWTIIACIGAVLYIYAGCNQSYSTLVNKMLSVKPIVFIGLISYSLYLWHWPIIAYLNYLSIEKTHFVKLIVLVISIILATITYLYVEKPFRHKFKFSFVKTLMVLWIMPIVFACCFALGSKYINNFGFNTITKQQQIELESYFGILKKESKCIDSGIDLPEERLCQIGDLSDKKTDVLVIGDSHAMADVGMLNVLLKKSQLKGYVITQSGSPFLLGNGIVNWRSNDPVSRNKKLADLIAKNHYKYVVLGGFWNYYSSIPSDSISSPKKFEVFERGFMEAIRFIVKNKSIPVIIIDNPSTLNLKKNCGISKIQLGVCKNDKAEVLKNQQIVDNIISKAKAEFPEVIIINPRKIMCDDSYCYLSHDGVPFYMSDGYNSHLNYAGSKLIGQLYFNRYGSPFEP